MCGCNCKNGAHGSIRTVDSVIAGSTQFYSMNELSGSWGSMVLMKNTGSIEMPYATVKFVDRKIRDIHGKTSHIFIITAVIYWLCMKEVRMIRQRLRKLSTIEKAAADSSMFLRTDNKGLNTSSEAADKEPSRQRP